MRRHWALILGLALATGLMLPLAYAELGRDQANWLTVAMALQEGSVMYRDVAVVNTPGLGVLFLAVNAVTGAPLLTPWVVHVLAVLATLWAGYVLVNALHGQAAANGAVLLAALLWPPTMGWWDLAQKDGVAFAFALSAMAVFVAGPDRRGLNLIAGALLTCTILTKTSAGIYALPALLLLILESPSLSVFLRRAGWITAGGLAALVPPALYFNGFDAWDAAHASLIERASAYGGFQRFSPDLILAQFLALSWSYFGAALFLPLVLLIPPLRTTRAPSMLLVLLGTTLFGAVLQGRGFVYHYVPAAAMLALVVGACLGAVFVDRGPWPRRIALALAILSVSSAYAAHQPRLTAYARGLLTEVPEDWRERLFSTPDKAGPDESRKVAAWIAQNTDAQELIFVWGMESQIYILADRMFVGPSFADAPIWQPQLAEKHPAYFGRQSAEFLKRLHATPPAVFVVARNDANPVEPMASDEALQTLPPLVAFLDENYTEQFSTRNLIVYQRD
ncbi:MAG: hypothetical protein OIF48_17040 [Silicimonas sp.]|nr:hypothetical protein [Silicimonas sp.]